jgi:hypothetical protein
MGFVYILLAHHGLWRVESSEMRQLILWLKFTDVSEDRTASIFGVRDEVKQQRTVMMNPT